MSDILEVKSEFLLLDQCSSCYGYIYGKELKDGEKMVALEDLVSRGLALEFVSSTSGLSTI